MKILIICDTNCAENYTNIQELKKHTIDFSSSALPHLKSETIVEYDVVAVLLAPENDWKHQIGIIRTQYTEIELPIIAIGLETCKELINEAVSAGANDFICEPEKKPELFFIRLESLRRLKDTADKLQKVSRQNRDVFEHSPIASVVVDRKGFVHNINKMAYKIFNIKPGANLNKLCGETLGCIHALKNIGKCGKLPLCSDCIIRTCIDQAFNTKKNVIKREGTFKMQTKENSFTVHVFLISCILLQNNGNRLALLTIEDISNQREAECKLKESEENHRIILQSQAQGIGFMNKEEIFEYANPAAGKIFENTNLVGTSLYSYVDKKNIKELTKQIHNRAKGETNSYQLKIKTSKGNYRYLNVTASPKISETGKYLGSYGIFYDITQQHEAERDLKESEELFKAISYYAQDAIILSDSDNKIKFWNKAAHKIFGYPAEEVLQKSFESLLVCPTKEKQDETGFKALQQYSKLKITDNTFECLGLRKNNTEFPIEASVSYIKIRGRIHALTILRDISDKKQREERLKKILENQPIALALSKEDTIVYRNKKFMDIYGYTLQDTPDINTWYEKAYPDAEYRTTAREQFEEDMDFYKKNSQTPSARTYNITAKDGNIINTELSFNLIDGLLIISFVDITEKIKRENRLKELNATKDKFVSILAHDLKTPFNTLIGFSDILLKKAQELDKDQLVKIAKIINGGSKQTYELLQNILKWARSQRGEIPFRPTTFKLSTRVKENITLIESEATGKGVALYTNTSEDIKIKADIDMLNTILRNLITNSVKFTQSGGSVTVESKLRGKNFEISVIDTGVGMSKDIRESLFSLDKTKSRRGTANEKGTGFGLLICKEFAEKHKGCLRVESKENKGSTFTLVLPASVVISETKKAHSNF